MGAVVTAQSSKPSRSLQTELCNGITRTRRKRQEAAIATAKAKEYLGGVDFAVARD